MNVPTDVREVRIKKLSEMREEGYPLYPNTFRPTASAGEILSRFADATDQHLREGRAAYALCGRVVLLRDFGKSCFFHIQDATGRLQAYVRRDELGEPAYQRFKRWVDIGDHVGVEGTLFRTRTGELTLQVSRYELLAKALRPLPEKFHGLRDVEKRYRKRYLDLIANPEVVSVFRRRAEVIRYIRDFFDCRGFLEVETPTMHPIAGGAAARPFETYHHALDQTLYLRIAPELYLKRLLVGGLERVYEIGKNFRNEGLSTLHNPEFTMIEFYQAYADYGTFMDLIEDLLCGIAESLCGSSVIEYQGMRIPFTRPWARIRLADALVEIAGLPREVTGDPAVCRDVATARGIEIPPEVSHGQMLVELFEHTVEPRLVSPTFVLDYPVEVSPLARTSDTNPSVVDRFELFVAGKEIANGFSELNDPLEQRRRFQQQVECRRRGDETAHAMDEDYLEALEYGMPPAAGAGIGIDRLVMLFTGMAAIRDVVLFPQMRPDRP
jgi:lysyl-tRNA synthetase class 2